MVATHSASAPSSLRIPSLDGVRCLGALLVVACHGVGTPGFPLGVANAYPLGHWGNLALQTFFVMSGFLITHLLIEEQQAHGHISLGRFYIRRTLRIFPVAYVYIVAMAVLGVLGIVEMTGRGALVAAVYNVNHYPARPQILSHFWTLSVEEQFYLLWPAVLVFVGRHRAGVVLGAVMLACPFLRLALWRWGNPEWRTMYWFISQADALAMGCLLACYRERLWAIGWYRRLVSSPWCAWVWALAALLATFTDRPRLYNFVLVSLILGLCAVFLDHVMRLPPWWLNHPWIAWGGTWTYSLYVWQQPFMNRYTGWTVTWFPLNVGLALVAGYLSFLCVEQPMQRLARRLTHRRPHPPQRVRGEDQRVQLLVIPKPGEVEA